MTPTPARAPAVAVAVAVERCASPTRGHAVGGMTGRYDQSELNTYGAEDDEEMDSILDALERADEAPKPTPELPSPKLDR